MQTIGMRDLKGKRVFPRLFFAVSLHSFERMAAMLFTIFVSDPLRHVKQFFTSIRGYEDLAEIWIAGLAVISELIRAYALLLLALTALFVAVSRF